MSLKARACVYVSALEASRARVASCACYQPPVSISHFGTEASAEAAKALHASAMGRSQPLKVMKKLKKVQAISERTGKPKIVRQDRGRILASVGVRIKAS